MHTVSSVDVYSSLSRKRRSAVAFSAMLLLSSYAAFEFGMWEALATTDADGDGLTYGLEFYINTQPQDWDSNNDGLPDGWEWQYGLNPLSASGDNGSTGDPDGDAFTNLNEYQYGIPSGWDSPSTPSVLDNGVWWNGTVPTRNWDEESAMQIIQGVGSDGADEDPMGNICNDQMDNDHDGLVDTFDPDGDGDADCSSDDDDGDGAIDEDPDGWDTDGDGMPDDFLSANCGATVATASFELASTGGQYTDTGNQTLNHTLANNAGESDVSYDAVSTVCDTGGVLSSDYTCSFTVAAGESMTFGALTAYTYSYHAATMTGPSGHYLFALSSGVYYTDWASNGGVTWGPFTEAGTYTWSQGSYGFGYAMMGFSATITGSDLGYDAYYVSTGGVGLTDGDYFGVTDYTSSSSSTPDGYTDGSQGYQMSDVDGIVQLAFESVSDADSVSLDIFVQSTGWESADYITISYVGASSSTILLDTNGYDINTDFSAMEGAWTTVSADVSGAGYLLVEFSSNSASEAIYLDNVVITSDGLDLDADDDNDGYDDIVDDCPYDANEHIDSDGDGYCDVQDTDDDNDGTYDWNDEFPLDPNEQVDNDQDGIGDNADDDDDNDGVLDVNDAFPNDATEWSDFDGDGIGDNADTDDDGDGESDAREDECGSDSLDASSVPSDFDGDGICDSIDTDNTDGPDYVPEEDTSLGWTNVVPGFPSLFAAIALIGAAFLGRRKDD